MPLHDWTRVRSGTYHHFHQRWIAAISDALNTGVLPKDFFALAEQRVAGPETDGLALQRGHRHTAGGISVLDSPPQTQYVTKTEVEYYARRADRLTIQHSEGEVVAIIEIVSPGNKDSRHSIRSLVEKSTDWIGHAIHLLIVDPFPTGPRDPQGIHGLIWSQFSEEEFALPNDKRRPLVSYQSGGEITAYVEPIDVGDALPDMPLFLSETTYVPCPLEATYLTAWEVFPNALKGALEA